MMPTKKWLTMLVALGFLFGTPLWSQAKTVNEKILDILLESKIVTPEKYQELKKQVETEEAEVAKIKAAAEKKTEGPKIDFNRGITVKTADGENQIRLSGRFQLATTNSMWRSIPILILFMSAGPGWPLWGSFVTIMNSWWKRNSARAALN